MTFEDKKHPMDFHYYKDGDFFVLLVYNKHPKRFVHHASRDPISNEKSHNERTI